MGLCQSQEEKDAVQKHKAIEKRIEEERAEQTVILKLLLLGAAESGKSTMLKQMRIIHDGGFSKEEIKQMRAVVFSNTINAMYFILISMKKTNVLLSDPRLEESAQKIIGLVQKENEAEPLNPEIVETLKTLWQDNGVQKIYKQKSRYQLMDSTEYFMNALDRTGQPDFMPTNDDILHTRVKTTGIKEVKFSINDETIIRVVDVGGQRSERRKWIQCFDDAAGIIFVVSLAGYDEVIKEDETTNRIFEAMRLFSTICNNDFFIHSSMILFLNKKDLFQEKIRTVPLSTCFTEYNGMNTYEACVYYIQEHFEKLNKVPAKAVFTHITCGTDTTQMQFVINTCFDLLMQRNLHSCGLY